MNYEKGDIITDFDSCTFGSVVSDENGRMYLFMENGRLYTSWAPDRPSHLIPAINTEAVQYKLEFNITELFVMLQQKNSMK